MTFTISCAAGYLYLVVHLNPGSDLTSIPNSSINVNVVSEARKELSQSSRKGSCRLRKRSDQKEGWLDSSGCERKGYDPLFLGRGSTMRLWKKGIECRIDYGWLKSDLLSGAIQAKMESDKRSLFWPSQTSVSDQWSRKNAYSGNITSRLILPESQKSHLNLSLALSCSIS